MRGIKLTQEKTALVDDVDYEELNKYRWHAYFNHGNWYAKRNVIRSDGKRGAEHMHQNIMHPPMGMQVDHINGNGLDNRRINLRLCDYAINQQNLHRIRGKSKYQGVGKDRNRWRSYIIVNGKYLHLGCFTTERMAAVAYNIAALIHYGSDAKINEI